MSSPPPSDPSPAPQVHGFFDAASSTVSYVVADPGSGRCALVDPVLDYDADSGRTATRSADALGDFVRERGFAVEWILETHVHADHLSAGAYLREQLGGALAIGALITEVQQTFGSIYNVEPEFCPDGSQFDRLLADGATFAIGALRAQVLHTPGHTPACTTYVIGDAAFVGDTLFMPDFGTARCDFPGGDARQLYRSIQRLFTLPEDTRLFMCHDYAPGGREVCWQTTVGAEKRNNIHVRDGVSEDEFVALREARDAQLGLPKLILPSVQINIRAGQLPPPEANGTRYLKIPLDTL